MPVRIHALFVAYLSLMVVVIFSILTAAPPVITSVLTLGALYLGYRAVQARKTYKARRARIQEFVRAIRKDA